MTAPIRIGVDGRRESGAAGVALGSWLSGFFILVTNAFMQHPAGYQIQPDGSLGIASISAFLLNPWAWVQYLHNQMAALVTGSFVVTAIGAFYMLRKVHPAQAHWGKVFMAISAFGEGNSPARRRSSSVVLLPVLNRNPLDLIKRDLIARTIIELRRPR